MSFTLAWCWHHMTREQYEVLCAIDERNYLARCPLVDYVRESAPVDVHPLFRRAREYRYDSAWFTIPEGEHVAEVRKRGIPRMVFQPIWFQKFRRVVTGEFEAT